MNVSYKFQLALSHHRAGDLQQAERFYREILNVEPDNPNALHLLGLVYLQLGNNDLAIEHIKKALYLNQNNPGAYNHFGSALNARGYLDVLSCDPFVTLQMWHFVKTSVALSTLFNESLDTGEDFDYYLRVWEKYRCIKIPLPFFYNRRGVHSQGSRSATGHEWRQQVEHIMKRYSSIHPLFTEN